MLLAASISEAAQTAEVPTARFFHRESVARGEFAEIEVSSKSTLSVLSLRLNGTECPWHWDGNLLILEQEISSRKNRIDLTAVLDGKTIVKMDTWTFS